MRSAHRHLSGLCLLLYVIVGLGLPLADGLLAARGGPDAAHVEDATNRHGTGHDHVSCELCRALDRNSALDVPAAPPALMTMERRLDSSAAPREISEAGAGRTSEARAPPRA